MKDTKYLSFLAAEKFLLTAPRRFGTMDLFSGEKGLRKGLLCAESEFTLRMYVMRA